MPHIYANGDRMGTSDTTMNLIKETEQHIMYEKFGEAKNIQDNTTE